MNGGFSRIIRRGARAATVAVVLMCHGALAGPPTLGTSALVPGATAELTLPVEGKEAKEIGKFYNQPVTLVKAGIAVPEGFDPAKSQRVLIVSATTSGQGISIRSMTAYLKEALPRGWVVIAADGEHGKPGGNNDTTVFRWLLVKRVLAEMHKHWPASRQWDYATGGMSGGGGYASHQGILLAKDDYRLIGMMLLSTGWCPADFGDDLKGGGAKLKKTPIFFSFGEQDKTCPPTMCAASMEKTRKAGFKQLRIEKFPEGHQIWRPHIALALEWFEQAPKAGS